MSLVDNRSWKRVIRPLILYGKLEPSDVTSLTTYLHFCENKYYERRLSARITVDRECGKVLVEFAYTSMCALSSFGCQRGIDTSSELSAKSRIT